MSQGCILCLYGITCIHFQSCSSGRSFEDIQALAKIWSSVEKSASLRKVPLPKSFS